jgi:GntR family transcriptional repressor for pyruvate dehydrogenase complex
VTLLGKLPHIQVTFYMESISGVSRAPLGEQVAQQLAEMISTGRLTPGQKLPPEATLCESLQVGRSTLREALKSLAFVGLVRMRAGDGTYVTEGSRRLLDRIETKGLMSTDKNMSEVREARLLLETELAALAAVRATAKDRSRLKSLGAELQASAKGNGRPYNVVDLEFHLAIAEASRNSVLSRILTDLKDLLSEWIAKSQEFPGGVENAEKHHTRILKFVLNGNAEGARRAMRQHLETPHKAYSFLSTRTGNARPA